jgi:hypothetical protein
MWARQAATRRTSTSIPAADDVRALLEGLAVPVQVLAVEYPHGCRIRRVRVARLRRRRRKNANEPLIILSRKLLHEFQLGSALRKRGETASAKETACAR